MTTLLPDRPRLPTGEVPWRLGDPDPALEETVRAGVAMWMLEMAGLTGDERRRRVPAGGVQLVASRGDILQWRRKDGRPSPATAATMNALCAGIADAADADGGVTVLGVHACTRPHPGCPLPPPPPPMTESELAAELARLRAQAIEEGFADPGEPFDPRPVEDVPTGGLP